MKMYCVKTVTTCYKRDWDADTNVISYLPIPAGTEGMVTKRYLSNLGSPVNVVELRDGRELHLGDSAICAINDVS